MPILFQCQCGRTLSASDDSAGKHARCPACNLIVPIPANAEPNPNLIVATLVDQPATTKAPTPAPTPAARQAPAKAPTPAPSPVSRPEPKPAPAPASGTVNPYQEVFSQPFPAQDIYAAPAPASPFTPRQAERSGRRTSQTKSAPWRLIAIGAISACMLGLLVVIGVVTYFRNSSAESSSTVGNSPVGNSTAFNNSGAPNNAAATNSSLDSASNGESLAPAKVQVNPVPARASFELRANDPLNAVVRPFLEAARRGSSTDALKLLDQDEFDKRLRSEKGSEQAQSKGLDTKKLISAFCSRSFESMPINGGVRHWEAVARTKYDGLDAVIVRYYCEPYPPFKWANDEESWQPLVTLITFDEFVGAVGGLFKEQPTMSAQSRFNETPPQKPDGNGLMLPRAGYMTLVFKTVGGQPRLVDIASTISNISLSRAAGELYLRDYRLIGSWRGDKVLATRFYPCLFGELEVRADTNMDNSQFIDPIAYYRRYPEKRPKVGPMPPEYRTNRLERLQRLVRLMDTNDSTLEAELISFRSDFRNDQAGDMAVVSFAMMRDEPEFRAEAVQGILAATERLYKETGDPFMNCVRWYASHLSGDSGGAQQAAKVVAKSPVQTAQWHQYAIEMAAKSGKKEEALACLKAYGNWWNPAPVDSSGELRRRLGGNWAAAKTRLEGRSGGAENNYGPFSRFDPNSPLRSRGGFDPNANPNFPSFPRPGDPGFGSPPRDMSGPPIPIPAGPIVTIHVKGQFDSGAAVQKLATTLKTSSYTASHSGNVGVITIGFAGDLKTVIDAIDFGTVESFDVQKREIKIKIP